MSMRAGLPEDNLRFYDQNQGRHQNHIFLVLSSHNGGLSIRDMHHPQLHKLAYRLRKKVSYHETDGTFQLVLSYPLKYIVLHPSWGQLCKRLSNYEFLSFDDILSLVGASEPDKIEFFLNKLVRKGFLLQQGVSGISRLPTVSVIVPVRNRPQNIKECLTSLTQLNYPKEKLEIIVVDDASTDNTPDDASQFPVQLISLKNNRQAPFCRNLAARSSKNDFIAFIDSDCLADPLWLLELIPTFKDASLGAIGGMVDSFYEDKGLERYEKVKSSLYKGAWPKRSGREDPFFYVPSCNLLVRRDVFLRLKGFEETLFVGEDVDFCWRLQKKGFHLEYRPVGKVYHKHRNKLMSFCRRRFEYGTSEPLLQQLHADKIKKLLIPPAKGLFLGMVVLSFISGYLPLLALSVGPILVDILSHRARFKAIPVKATLLVLAVVRSYLAFVFQCCSFVSRYYLIWSISLLFLLPTFSVVILGMHLLTGVVEYFIKRPNMNLALFLIYFSLEQLAYQLGVWWGCLRHFSFTAINPKLVNKLKG